MGRMEKWAIGATPCDEECEQVGTANYNSMKARRECESFKRLLYATYPLPKHLKDEAYLTVKSSPHDFGSYYEVYVVFNEENEEAVAWAVKVEGETPAEWPEGDASQPTITKEPDGSQTQRMNWWIAADEKEYRETGKLPFYLREDNALRGE